LYNGEKYPYFIEIENESVLDSLRLNTESQNYFAVDNVDKKLIEKLKAIDGGLLLITGSEDELGLKSFDQLDEIFELINEY
jgi:hypothetical protein